MGFPPAILPSSRFEACLFREVQIVLSSLEPPPLCPTEETPTISRSREFICLRRCLLKLNKNTVPVQDNPVMAYRNVKNCCNGKP